MSEDDSIATPPKGFVTVAPLRRKVLASGKVMWAGVWAGKRLYIFAPNVRSGDDHEWDLCVRLDEYSSKEIP